MQDHDNGIRKAAILALSLDRPATDRLLDCMDPQQARQVRQAMVDLDSVDPKEQRRVLDEFFRVEPPVPRDDPPGIELDALPLARPSLECPPATAQPASEPEPSAGQPFRFLRQAEAEKLAGILVSERPQTISLVLSHLPPEQAGDVLVRFAPAMQADVIRRLVDLGQTAPEVLRDVERALEFRLSEQVHMQKRRVAGLSAVAGILEASSTEVGTQILGSLASHEWQLVEKLSPQRLHFEDLPRLVDLDLAVVLRTAGQQLTILALVGAPPPLVDRFLEALTQSAAEAVRHELDHLGPTRLSDVEEARRQVAALAWRLALERRISLPEDLETSFGRPQGFAAAA